MIDWGVGSHREENAAIHVAARSISEIELLALGASLLGACVERVEHRRIVGRSGGAFKNLPEATAIDFDALVGPLRFIDASFEAEIQTDGLHQLRRTEGFIRERPDDCGLPEAPKGNLLKFVGGPIAHVDRRHSAAKLRIASDNIVGAMRNGGSADADALLCRRLNLLAISSRTLRSM